MSCSSLDLKINSADQVRRDQLRADWQDRGFSPRASAVLANARVEDIQQLQQLDRETLALLPQCGRAIADEIAVRLGWRSASPLEALTAALQLAISDRDEAREAAVDAVIALRRSGFVIVSKQKGEKRDLSFA